MWTERADVRPESAPASPAAEPAAGARRGHGNRVCSPKVHLTRSGNVQATDFHKTQAETETQRARSPARGPPLLRGAADAPSAGRPPPE